MADNTTTTLPAVQEMKKLPELLATNIPLLEKRKGKAIDLLDSLTKPTDDEEAEQFIANLAAVRAVYDANSEMRKVMTAITDAFKDVVMDYERDLNPDAKAKSKYNEKKKLLEEYQQEKMNRIRKEQADQLKKKDLENLKVDLRTSILNLLEDTTVDVKTKLDDYARDFFSKLTLAEFDEKSEKFKRAKPKLSMPTYEACFATPSALADKVKTLFAEGAYQEFIKEVQVQEPYDKWNDRAQQEVAPVMNEWYAKIPTLKAECTARANAADDATRKALDEARTKRDEEELALRNKNMNFALNQKKAEISENAELSKVGNELQAQAVAQNLGDVGRAKLVLKFSDVANAPKALIEIMYHCMRNPEFSVQYPGFQKRDQKKKLMFDDKNRPVYIDAVQFWIDYFMKECDAEISGTTVSEDAKVTIRG